VVRISPPFCIRAADMKSGAPGQLSHTSTVADNRTDVVVRAKQSSNPPIHVA
jgi:hypothetical protein